jgi:tetratricopeptide (TPR) repeat protein
MLTKRTLTKLQTGILLVGFCLHSVTVTAQSNASSAKQHLERALSYSAAKDPRAEEEYKQAIAARGGVYPEAWEAFSTYLAYALRFEEAAAAWRKYLKQTKTKVSSIELERRKRLDRGALLRSRYDDRQSMSLEEMLELTKLVDGFGSTQDAVPYAERAAELYPQSGEALIALAKLIKNEQRDRALDLLNRAISFEPNNPSFYVARGGYFFWVQGNPRTAEADFRKAIELSRGTNASAWAGLGDSLARIGRRDEALAAYRHYLSIRPKSAAHYDGEIRKSIELLENNTLKP